MFTGVLDALSQDLAIDLGSNTVRIARRGRGVVLREPSALALHRDGRGARRLIATGAEARQMLGRVPMDIDVIRPIRDGVIADFEAAETLLGVLLQRCGAASLVKPKAAVCIPAGTTEVERRAVRECAEAAGVREVTLIDAPLAGAVGAAVDVGETHGNMVVDIGAGRSSVSVFAMGELVSTRAIRVGSEAFDEALIRYLRAERGLLIGPATAEEAKQQVGAALVWGPNPAELEVRGRDLSTGFPRAYTLTVAEAAQAMSEPVRAIVEAVIATLERTPPELAADIGERGVVLIGDGARLPALDRAIGEAAGVPAVLIEHPGDAVVLGALALAHQHA
jgi:rod shape-determining protein MreB